MKLFCYGTLMRGEMNHARLDGAVFLREAWTKDNFALFTNGSFPAVVYGTDPVKGEIYEVPDDMWQMLDDYEGVGGKWYTRKTMMIDNDEVNYYYGVACFNLGSWTEIKSGDFKNQ